MEGKSDVIKVEFEAEMYENEMNGGSTALEIVPG